MKNGVERNFQKPPLRRAEEDTHEKDYGGTPKCTAPVHFFYFLFIFYLFIIFFFIYINDN